MCGRSRWTKRDSRRATAIASSRSTSPGLVGSSTMPLEIWEAVVATTTELIASLDQPVAALGITNQRETVVVWDRRSGKPLHRALVWQDRRTAERCEALEAEGRLPLVRDRTGLVLDPYFSASKLEWLLTEGGVDAGPQLAFGTVDAWLVWKLTGGEVHATESSNASRTMLFDIRRLEWSDELCDLFSVPTSCLPELRPSSGRLGVTHPSSGLPAGIPISGVAGDQQAALFGQACFEPGMTKNTYGTGSFVLMNVGDRCPDPVEGLAHDRGLDAPRHRRHRTTCARTTRSRGRSSPPARPSSGCATGSASSARRPRSGRWPRACPDTEGVYLVPAFTGLGSPWWDPYARATIVGITRGTGRAHLARAAVEAMAYQTRDVVEAMSAHSGSSGHRAARRRRRLGDEPPPATAGGPAAGPGGSAPHPGDDGTRRGLPRRSRGGRVVVARRDHGELGARRRGEPDRSLQRPLTPRTPSGAEQSSGPGTGPASLIRRPGVRTQAAAAASGRIDRRIGFMICLLRRTRGRRGRCLTSTLGWYRCGLADQFAEPRVDDASERGELPSFACPVGRAVTTDHESEVGAGQRRPGHVVAPGVESRQAGRRTAAETGTRRATR